jgi:hypothetical protein
MLAILDEFRRAGADPRKTSLKVGIFGAEPWTNAMRAEIEAAFDMHAVDIYGLSEVIGPGVANECVETKDGLTIWEDHFFPEIVDPVTGVVRAVELFVAVLGASNYTYAEATETQRSADFIQSHSRAMEYMVGVPALIIPDQLKTGVREPCRYEPILQRTYEEWAAHYGTAILPARPAKARDKAKVEVAVQVAQRWILARLRHETFFTLAALNARIRELLVDLNARPMKGYGGASRRDLFERFDRPALHPLPAERFVYTEWRQARVNIDYHINVEHHL